MERIISTKSQRVSKSLVSVLENPGRPGARRDQAFAKMAWHRAPVPFLEEESFEGCVAVERCDADARAVDSASAVGICEAFPVVPESCYERAFHVVAIFLVDLQEAIEIPSSVAEASLVPQGGVL